MVALFSSILAFAGSKQDDQLPENRKPKFPDANEEPRMPDGKSQKNAIAKEQHAQALKDAEQLLSDAQDLHNALKGAGSYVVSLDSVKKTEEIEKLAKRIRGRLKS